MKQSKLQTALRLFSEGKKTARQTAQTMRELGLSEMTVQWFECVNI